MTKTSLLGAASDAQCRSALEHLLAGYVNPAFSVLPKREVELLVLDCLIAVKALPAEPTLHDLITQLRVTRSKARSLLYDRELRRQTSATLDDQLRRLLTRPLFQKQGELFALDIENPLLGDHVRKRLAELGHASDGSFSPTLVRISLDAAVALMADLLDPAQRKDMRTALEAAGAPRTGLAPALKAIVRKLATKLADDTGGAMVDQLQGVLEPFFAGARDTVMERVRDVFKPGS
jgi:hypothetical protein